MSQQIRTRTKTKVLVDAVRSSAVDDHIYRFRRRLCLIALLILALVVLWFLWRFKTDRPVDYSDIGEHFKYGSIGSEPGGSLRNPMGGLLPPEKVFLALPEICPDLLPGGYASLGFIFEEGKTLPIGVSQRRRLGFDQAGVNCAICHTGTVRDSPDSDPRIYLGMPAHQLRLQEFFRFIVSCTQDARFTADNVVGTIGDLGFVDRFLYSSLVPVIREQTADLQARLGLILGDEITPWGPGRVDTFNPYKALQFNWKLSDLPRDELVAGTDYPALWLQEPRQGMDLHWDGNNSSLEERNLSASLGTGVTPTTIDHGRLGRVRDWARTLPPPEYPYPIDEARAADGYRLYRQYCLDCHADHRFRDGVVEGDRVGKVEPIEYVGTDRHRLDAYTYAFAANQYTLYPDSEYSFKNFKKTDGYANQPLDAVWLRAPYLHNGSVPSLRTLLEPPENRPVEFYRGNDVFDPVELGFVYQLAEQGGREFWPFDTRLDGNGNGGHLYGCDLSPDEKDAIVEYMKKL
jgi:mono/diheme cytochrome c family protein